VKRTVLALAALSAVAAGLAAAALSLAAGGSASAPPAPWATLAFSRSEIVGGGVFLAGRGNRVIGLVPGGTDPAWTPDGRRLAYVAPGAAGSGDLFVVDADGSHKGRITDTIDDEQSPDWSPDGMRLVVERDGNVVVVRADGQGSRRLAAGLSPVWSPGGGRIAYSDGDDLYSVRPGGGRPRKLYGAAGAQTEPAWSPDGRRIAFISDESGFADVIVLDLKTGGTTRLTADEAVDSSPAFSANGGHVVFASAKAGVETLWRVPVGGVQAVPELATPYAAAPAIRRIPALAALLPDLEQRAPADLSLRTVKRGGRRHFLLGFDSATDNIGLGPVILSAHRSSRTVPFMRASQLARMARGSRHTYPRIGVLRYVRSSTHNHWHVLGFQRYELRRVADNGVVVRDHKSGFCLADHYAHAPGTFALEPRHPVFTDYCEQGNPQALLVFQGTSVGYTDRYPSYFHGQNLDLTGAPAGNYVLVHRANRRLLLHELRYENNAASLRIRIRWPHGRSRRPSVEIVRRCPDSDRC
jgi:hypothetical protein